MRICIYILCIDVYDLCMYLCVYIIPILNIGYHKALLFGMKLQDQGSKFKSCRKSCRKIGPGCRIAWMGVGLLV